MYENYFHAEDISAFEVSILYSTVWNAECYSLTPLTCHSP